MKVVATLRVATSRVAKAKATATANLQEAMFMEAIAIVKGTIFTIAIMKVVAIAAVNLQIAVRAVKTIFAIVIMKAIAVAIAVAEATAGLTIPTTKP
jgi:hypothetical protein